jgi:hypothetical protein
VSDGEDRPLLPAMRALLVVAGVLVLLAGVQLYVLPLRTDRWFAWTVDPPMTAVFLGGSYWAAAAFEWSAARSRTWAGARISVPAVFVFTSLTLVVTLVHLDRFHTGAELAGSTRAVTWAWVAVYTVVPALMAVVWWRQARVPGVDPPRRRPLPSWLRVAVGVQAVLFVVVGVWLLVDPVGAGRWWPWTVTALTGRAIGAWVVSLGVAAAHAVVEGDAERVRPAAVADVAFALLQGVALARHGDALDAGAASTWVYATVLAAMAVIGVAALAGGRAG